MIDRISFLFLLLLSLRAHAIQPTSPPLTTPPRVSNRGETEEIYVRSLQARIFARPSYKATVIREAVQGEAFTVSRLTNGFYQIEYEDGQFGYLSESAALPDSATHSIATANPTATCKNSSCYLLREPRNGADSIVHAQLTLRYEVLGDTNEYFRLRLDTSRFAFVEKRAVQLTFPKNHSDTLLLDYETEKAKLTLLENQIIQLKKDSSRIRDTLLFLRQSRFQQIDSIRVSINERYRQKKDSLTTERTRQSDLSAGTETITRLIKKKETLLMEIGNLRRVSKKVKERIANLKVLAQYEFDIDTSARAKDSLNALTKSCDSSAFLKEGLLKSIDQDILQVQKYKPGDGSEVLSQIEAQEKLLPSLQKAEALALMTRQNSVDPELALLKSQWTTEISTRLKKARQDYKIQVDRVKSLLPKLAKAKQ